MNFILDVNIKFCIFLEMVTQRPRWLYRSKILAIKSGGQSVVSHMVAQYVHGHIHTRMLKTLIEIVSQYSMLQTCTYEYSKLLQSSMHKQVLKIIKCVIFFTHKQN